MSLFCSGWTFIWLLLLPFGIVPDTAAGAAGATWWAMLPISVMTIMMLGLEDLACQLEDPFKFIPYGRFKDVAIEHAGPLEDVGCITQRKGHSDTGEALRAIAKPSLLPVDAKSSVCCRLHGAGQRQLQLARLMYGVGKPAGLKQHGNPSRVCVACR
jgi:hypothetical protein